MEEELKQLRAENHNMKEQLRLENQRAMIEKWNGVMPTYMLGENANALFNLGQ